MADFGGRVDSSQAFNLARDHLFALQLHVTTASANFRWCGQSPTTVFAVEGRPVQSEGGITVQADGTLEDFAAEDFDCLVLPGCSDLRESIRVAQLVELLWRLTGDPGLVIGAIGSGACFSGEGRSS